MVKTSVYLPEALKLRLERTARTQNRSEAEVIRAALDEFTSRERPRPTLPLFTGDVEPTIAERVDELLDGFGER